MAYVYNVIDACFPYACISILFNLRMVALCGYAIFDYSPDILGNAVIGDD